MKCSKRKCPIQYDAISEDCNIEDCPYRTEDIEPQEVIKALCNYIADLVVQKLKTESGHKCHTCKHYTSGEHDGSCGSYICKEYSNWERSK